MLNNALWAPVLEYLEPRLLLSGAIESAELVSIDWYGQTIQAHADEWIVRLDDGIAGKQYTSLLESELVEKGIAAGSLASIGQSQFGLLRAPGLSIKQVNAWAGKYSGVLYAEPNFVYSISSGVTPNDPALTNGSLWGLNNTGQSGGTADADIDAPEAWSITTGSSDVVIGVIDTGVDYTHADLVGNMWVNPGETVGDGIDNDANGYIDDVYGWDFVNNDNDPMDGHGHGTHVSGTIGGVGDDGSGIVGVNWDVSIMALKFLDDSGSGSTGDAIAAIDYATMMRQYYGINVVATNNSWGGGMYSSALLDAIETAGQEGILFVAAAGNESQNNDVVTHYPSDYNSQYILSVAATDRDDELASFSNYGAVAVDLAAPGVSIYSSVPGNGYASYNGTSMAAPHVAGVVALLAASQPDAAAGEIRDAILAGVDPIANLTGLTATGGRLNAYSSLLMLGTFGPRVMSVNPSGFAAPVDEINIHFSENLLASSVVGANFMLRNNGPDDTFDTADDNVFTITNLNVSLVAGNRVSISLATDLPLEDYRVTVAGTGANPVRDADNNALNEGVDHEHFFTIVSPYGANEHNDKMSDATDSGLVGIGEVSFSGEIGDGLWGYDDVDLFVFQANEPGTFVAETDTTVLGSDLDTVLRLFDSDGNELDWNDDWDFPDSRIEYELETAGTYYLGVSSYSNYDYDPRIEDGWYGDSIGGYYLTMKLLGRPEIHGSKWSDANANGVRDEGEAGLAGWTIFLDTDVDGVLDPGELSTITDAEGNYSFVDLNAGTYVVAEIPKARWQQTYPLSVDADSYVGITSELQFEDIRYTGQPVLFNTDDESHYLSPADLGGFEFPLYGVNYDEVYISTNGLITFEDEATSWFNGDLSLYPQGAAIAVLWDDLELRSAIGGAVYWELQGWYAEERLIIQWQNAEFVEAYDYDENYTDLVTFQAILGADGSITLSYSDLDTDGDVGHEAELATVGVKGSMFFGHRILFGYDSGPNQYVGTGKSTHLVKPLAGQHAVYLDVGEVATEVLFGSQSAIIPGDADRSGTVDSDDLTLLLEQFGSAGQNLSGDFNGDGYVDLSDFVIMRANFGTSNPVAQAVSPAPSIAAASTLQTEQAIPLAGSIPIDQPQTPPRSQTPSPRPDAPDIYASPLLVNIDVDMLQLPVGRPALGLTTPYEHLFDRGELNRQLDSAPEMLTVAEVLDDLLSDILIPVL